MSGGRGAGDALGQARIEFLLGALAEGFDARAWHGSTLRGSLRRVPAEEAILRPAPERHSIWELALHCAYWKHRVTCRISGHERRFERSPSNFPDPARPASPEAWKEDLALLDQTHATLLETVRGLDPRTLDDPAPKATRAQQILGAAMHDVYHAGQVRLSRKLLADE